MYVTFTNIRVICWGWSKYYTDGVCGSPSLRLWLVVLSPRFLGWSFFLLKCKKSRVIQYNYIIYIMSYYYYYHYYYCCLIFFVKTIWDENFMPKVSFFMWVLWWISASSPRGCRRGSRCPRDWFVTCLHDDKTDDAIWCYMMLWCYEEMWRYSYQSSGRT